MHYTPSIARAFFRLPEQKGEDQLRFSYQGVPHQQCILLPSIARALIACHSKKGRTHCASLIKVYRTSNAFYSPPSLDLWSLAKAKREDPLRFSYQGVPHPQCILLPSIARPLVACQSKKGRTCCASLIKAYRTSNAFYSPP